MIPEFCTWLEATPPALAITESEWIFPTIETIHVFGLAIVFGSIAMLDLRLLGLANRQLSVLRMTQQTLTWTWTAFVVCAITRADVRFGGDQILRQHSLPHQDRAAGAGGHQHGGVSPDGLSQRGAVE
jgi:hypothetical protein